MDLGLYGTDVVQQQLAREFLSNGYRLVKYAFNVIIPSGTPSQFKFPTLEILRDKHLRYLQVFNIDYVSKTAGPRNNIPLANFETMFITLKNNENIALHDVIPSVCFDAQQVNLQGLYYVGDVIISFDNSIIDIITTSGLTAGEAIPFVAHYWNHCKNL